MNVRRVDLGPQERPLREQVLKNIEEVIDSHDLILGRKVSELEKKVAEYISVPDAIGVGSGTEALMLSLSALGVKRGDEVITPPFTMAANLEAIMHCGATPVFADVERGTFNIIPEEIEKKITPRTKGIIPVHLFGCPCEIEKILEVAEAHNLFVLEDCAQSFGAHVKGKKCGSFGELSATSFYPTKNLGGYGDGGMIFVNNTKYSQKIRQLRSHGETEKYHHKYVGWTSRLDEIQAAIILPKLGLIDKWNSERRKIAEKYKKRLSKIKGIELPIEPRGAYHVYHLYTIKAERRKELEAHLEKNGIGFTINYPIPLHLQEAYSSLGYKKGDFPNAEWLCGRSISIPLFVGITGEQIEYVCRNIEDFYED